MAGNVHAILLIVFPVATAWACRKFWMRPGLLRLFGAVVAGSFLALFAGASAVVWTYSGQPATQWILPGICLVGIIAFVKEETVRTGLTLVWTLTMFGMCHHYLLLVNGPGYTGNPNIEKRWAAVKRSLLRSVSNRLATVTSDNSDYPAGWLAESSILTKHDKVVDRRSLTFSSTIVSPFWHSWLTGLYRSRSVPQAVWYPGGRLREGRDHLEVRDVKTSDGPARNLSQLWRRNMAA